RLSHDDYEPDPGIDDLKARIRALEGENRALSAERDLLNRVETFLQAALQAERAERTLLEISTSWRLTRPLRMFRQAALLGEWRVVVDQGLRMLAERDDRSVVGRLARRSQRPMQPRWERRAFTILTPHHTDYVAHSLAKVLREESFEVEIRSSYKRAED